MAFDREQTEFYVTCHPPLRLKGVEEVINLAARQLGERLNEIVYEPELPAFKVISALDDRDAIMQEVQQILADVLHKGLDMAKGRSSSSTNEEDLLEFDSDSSGRVTPWSEYDKSDEAGLAQFDNYRFPRDIQEKPTKIIWRGLEEHTGWTFRRLVDEVKRFWNGRNVPVDILGLTSHFGCQIRWNRAETLVYMGTDLPGGLDSLKEATIALQNLLRFFAVERIKSKHLVLSDCQKNAQFAFKPFSSLGFDNSTYLTPISAKCYPRMRRAVTVRSTFSDGEPPQSHQASGCGHHLDSDMPAMFGIFDNCVPLIGAAKGLAAIKKTDDEAMDDLLQIVGTTDHQLTWCWLTGNAKPNNKRVGSRQVDESQDSQSEDLLPEPVHLLDVDVPDLFPTEDFIPLQHPMLPLWISDETSASSIHSMTETEFIEPYPLHDDSDLIEFEDSSEEISVDSDPNPLVPTTMPPEIQELGNAFGKLELKDCLGICEGDVCSGTQKVQALSGLDDHLEMPPPASSSPRKGEKDFSTPITKFWTIAKPKLQFLFDILRLTPGRVGLEARLGRAILCNFDDRLICKGLTRQGPSRTAEWTSQYLQSRYTDSEEDLRFSTMLSTCAADATLISKIKSHGKGEWETSNRGRKILYDLLCRPKDPSLPVFTISVDAETFSYEVTATSNDLGSAYIHCPQSAWDMKIVAVHRSSPQEAEKWKDFSKLTIESLHVSHTPEKDIILNLTEKANSAAAIEGIRIRRVVDYGNTCFPGSIMTITLTRLMNMRRKLNNERGPGQHHQIQAKPQEPIRKTANPNQWIELTMQSRQGRKMFDQNDESMLRFGQKAAWNDMELAMAPGGVLDELCWPALGMIREMNACGLCNDNNQATKPLKEKFSSAKPTQPAAEKTVFW